MKNKQKTENIETSTQGFDIIKEEKTEIESNEFNTKQNAEDNTRFGDWVIKGQAIDF